MNNFFFNNNNKIKNYFLLYYTLSPLPTLFWRIWSILCEEEEFQEFPEDVYIDSENDPCGFDKVEEETIPLFKEKKIGFDKVVASVESKIENLSNYDHMMEEKVLDALRKGKLK